MSMILAGDINASHFRIALFDLRSHALTLIRQKVYINQHFENAYIILKTFLLDCGAPKIDSACLGVEGPVMESKAVLSNRPWILEVSNISSILNSSKIYLLNEMETVAYGVGELRDYDLFELNPKGSVRKIDGNRAMIFPGATLNQCMLFKVSENCGGFVPAHFNESEKDHAEFSPGSSIEDRLYEYLSKRYSRVGLEKVLSCPGLVNIYRFLLSEKRMSQPDGFELSSEKTGNPAQFIAEAGLEKGDEICRNALEIFSQILARESANLALKTLATGGLLIGGKLAPNILSVLKEARFFKTFVSKNKMNKFLNDVPISLILNNFVGVLGAARVSALSLLENKYDAKTRAEKFAS